jgi:SAM-dependent methyltransferase
MNLSHVDFGQLYRGRMQQMTRRERDSEYWDGRAAAMSDGEFTSPYVRQFVDRMDLADCRTLLDVGCGPGTISLTVAGRLEQVYGLDYSPGMLAAFSQNARQRGLTGATPILRAWNDDWADVPTCDVVVASRSTAVPDLEAAILKLESKARRRVYLTYPADGRLGGDEIREAMGRASQALPDYLCVIGILHHLGVYPTLAYLPGKSRFATCSGFANFHAKVIEVLGDVTVDEVERLRTYFDTRRDAIARESMRWALFSWEPRPHAVGR